MWILVLLPTIRCYNAPVLKSRSFPVSRANRQEDERRKIQLRGGSLGARAAASAQLKNRFGGTISFVGPSDEETDAIFSWTASVGMFKRLSPAAEGLSMPTWLAGEAPSEERLLQDKGWGFFKELKTGEMSHGDEVGSSFPYVPLQPRVQHEDSGGDKTALVSALGFNVTLMTRKEAATAVGDFATIERSRGR